MSGHKAIAIRRIDWIRWLIVLVISPVSVFTSTLRADEPATVERTEALLDLRTAKLPEGVKAGGIQTLGIVLYEHKTDAKSAFEFQRKQLSAAGWKELPGGYADDKNLSGHLTKDGFRVALSASSLDYDPMKAGWANVSVVNYGNVPAEKLPKPLGVKPFHSSPAEASYVSEDMVANAAEACKKLLIAEGWEPYGRSNADPASPMIHFKRNGIQVMLWVQTAAGAGNKTLIRYSTEVLSADLPVPPDARDPDYNDSLKRVTFALPGTNSQPVFDFYQKQLPEMGWKATTEKPITDDRNNTAFMIFRNEKKDLLSLDLRTFKDVVNVELTHQTEAEVAAEEERAKVAAEKARIEKEKREAKMNVAIAVPADAGEIETLSKNSFEFPVASGAGPAAFKNLRDQLTNSGWTEKKEAEEKKNYGSMEFEKGTYDVRISYRDAGVSNADVSVRGSTFVVFEPTRGTAEMGMPLKKPTTIQGFPGVDIPDGLLSPKDLEQLKKAQELFNPKSKAKTAPKKPPRRRVNAG